MEKNAKWAPFYYLKVNVTDVLDTYYTNFIGEQEKYIVKVWDFLPAYIVEIIHLSDF